uniref:Transposase n=1 Tax=Ascaris lumbricoides TaxID=6252 RepID=A0A0M3HQL8_ASCLU
MWDTRGMALNGERFVVCGRSCGHELWWLAPHSNNMKIQAERPPFQQRTSTHASGVVDLFALYPALLAEIPVASRDTAIDL